MNESPHVAEDPYKYITQSFKSPFFKTREIPTQFTKQCPTLGGCPAWLKPAFINKKNPNQWVVISSLDTIQGRTVKEVPDLEKPIQEVLVYDKKQGKDVLKRVQPTKMINKVKKNVWHGSGR